VTADFYPSVMKFDGAVATSIINEVKASIAWFMT
jgi:hypothetical protein